MQAIRMRTNGYLMATTHRISGVLAALLILATGTVGSLHAAKVGDHSRPPANSIGVHHTCVACELGAVERTVAPTTVPTQAWRPGLRNDRADASRVHIAPAYPVALRAPPALS
jgi:hypothetical protein